MTITGSIGVDTFRDAVRAAVRAPSVYNVQPWRFALRDGQIDVRIDPDRRLPVADPDQWSARIACGAAIANIQLAMAVASVGTNTRMWPDADDPLLVATITADGPCTASPRQIALFEAIPHRHSNRRPFFDAAVPNDVRAQLVAAAEDVGGWLVLASDRDSVARIAEIIRSAEDRLHRNAAYVAEMRAWIGRDATAPEGIPTAAAGTAPAGQDLLAMRDFGGTERAAGRNFEEDPLVGVIGTIGRSRYDDVTAGLALQRVLLTAVQSRLMSSMLSQAIEIPDAREDLRQVVGRRGSPQMVIRLGFGQPVSSVPRRPIDSVIDLIS